MVKEKNIDVIKMIGLEQWLQENKQKNVPIKEFLKILSKMTEEEINYIIIANIMPLEEIESAIEYLDGQNFPIIVDKTTYINWLAEKYSTSRNDVIERINQVRMIKLAQKNTNKTKKRKKHQK